MFPSYPIPLYWVLSLSLLMIYFLLDGFSLYLLLMVMQLYSEIFFCIPLYTLKFALLVKG